MELVTQAINSITLGSGDDDRAPSNGTDLEGGHGDGDGDGDGDGGPV